MSGLEIYVDMSCQISRASLLPTKDCGQPYIVIEKKIPDSSNSFENLFKPNPYKYFNLLAGDISLGYKSMFESNYDPKKKVQVSDMMIGSQKSHELFIFLMSASDTPLTLKTRAGTDAPIKIQKIILTNFKKSTENFIEAIHRRYDQQQTAERQRIFFALCLSGGALASALWLLLFVVKRGRIQLQTTKQKFEMKRVARVAEDEAIREVVRISTKKIDDSELDMLRSQIKVALDADDTETAEKLLSILKKSSK